MQIFGEVKRRHDFVLVVTTSPKAYVKTSQHFKGAENVQVALGFHPELVGQRLQEQELLFKEMRNCAYVGEIGIDGSKRNIDSYGIQKKFFTETICRAEELGGRILSIHSRTASKDVLQILKENINSSIPILHWFTGNVGQARQALSMGCWFSINPNMCLTSGGKKIIDEIPITHILPETDAPFAKKNGMPYMPWDDTVIKFLAIHYRVEREDILRKMESNLNKIRKYAEGLNLRDQI